MPTAAAPSPDGGDAIVIGSGPGGLSAAAFPGAGYADEFPRGLDL